MKRSISLIFLLIVVTCLSGCGGISIKSNTLKADMLNVIYPSIENLKNKTVRDKLNSMLYSRSMAFLNDYSMFTGKAAYSSAYNITYNKHDIVSIRFLEGMIFPVDNEAMSRIKSMTFNIKDGTVYSLDAIFHPGTDHKTLLNKLMNEVIKDNGMILLKEFKGVEKDQEFYLSKEGLTICYQAGIYMPVRLGPFSVLIKYPKIKGYLRKELGI